jgi:1-acyl-sn-glycerol-3-phosphate acyltransferase
MIPAQHKKWADWLFKPFIYWLLKRDFGSLRVVGAIPNVPKDMPIILMPNHATWWDGFFVYLLNNHLFGRKFYIMMLAEQLKKYWFFRMLGAFGFSQQSRPDIVATMKYSLGILRQKPSPLVIIFPQGTLLPFNTRPLGFKSGIEWLASQMDTPVCILPLAMRCEFLGERKPDVYFLFGEPMFHSRTSPLSIKYLEQYFTTLLDDLEARIVRHEAGKILLGQADKTSPTTLQP